MGHDAGRWLRYPAQPFKAYTDGRYALTVGGGLLEPKVRQARVNGRKVVVVSWRNGTKFQVANTGPAYPLRADFKGHRWWVFSEYNVPVDIAAPTNAIDGRKAG